MSLLKLQKNEITEFHVYSKLARKVKDKHNKRVLLHIAADEKKHYNLIKKITKKDVSANYFKVKLYLIFSFIFGLSFSLRLMEKGEQLAQKVYGDLSEKIGRELMEDEQRHEKELLGILSEERIEYAGSIVLGLNDALVELTGALAGLTFALGNGRVIAVTGIVIGFAAALSMAASGYLSSKEDGGKNPFKGALYTGSAYLVTVVVLVAPYILFESVFVALAVMLTLTVTIIAFYILYITTAKGQKFWKKFLEMALISLGVAVISFGVGLLLRKYVGV